MKSENWQKNYNQMKFLRKELKDKYGFHVKEEMHTKHFLTDKDPYRKYGWSKEEKKEFLNVNTFLKKLKIVKFIKSSKTSVQILKF